MKSLIIISVLAILFLGCTGSPPQGNNTNNTTWRPPVVSGNNTSNVTKPVVLPPDYTVSLGDNVSVWYTLFVDGKVYDTNNATLANESGIYNYGRKYEPLKFTVQFNKGLIDGFIIGVIGMRVNETLAFNIDPQRGYGFYDPKKIIIIPRYYQKNITETVPRSFFEESGIDVVKGAGFNTQYGTVFIDSFNDENVTIAYLLQTGKNLTVNGIPQQVVGMWNGTATLEYMLMENQSYLLPNPDTGAGTLYKVTAKTDENITLDYNHPLANETLRFKVTLISAVPHASN